jgi:hypothetical protein
MIGTIFHSRAGILVASAAAVTALTVAVAPTAHSDTQWGACAVPANPALSGNATCVGPGGVYTTEADATNRATQMCNYLRDRQCSVVVSFTDCGAIAQSGGGQWAGGTGPTLDAAQQAALNQLPGSTIRKSVCVAG